MEKILPIDIEPMIKTYGSVGNYLGILNALGYDTKGILMNHYIDLYYANKKVGFIQRDYIRLEKFYRQDFIFSENNFIEKVRTEINNNNYILLILNELFINNDKIHRDYAYCHDWLVYGYNDELHIFKVLGYYGYDKFPQVYGSVDISYEDLQKSALKALNEKHIFKNTDLDNNVRWPKEVNIEEKVDVKKVKKTLKGYLRGQPLFYKNQPFTFTGKNAIEFIIRFHKVAKCKFSDNKPVYFDVRNYRFCLENKKVIYLILKNYSADFHLADKYDCDVINNLHKVLMLSAKYIIKPNCKINDSIIELLTSAQQAEKQILKTYLQEK